MDHGNQPKKRAVTDAAQPDSGIAGGADRISGCHPGNNASHHKTAKSLKRLLALLAVILAAATAFTLIRIALKGRETYRAQDGETARAVSGGIGGNVPESHGIMSYARVTENTRTLTDEVDSKYAILIDVEKGEVLAEKDGDAKIYPASMTKIMTMIVAYENLNSLDDTFEMTLDITDPLYVENASVAGFLNGEQVTARDLIYGLILPSGADCACALAIMCAGGEEAFAEMMNEKVEELGLENTHFTNPTGLHDAEQYSTCHDIALILEYACRDEFMKTVLSTYEYTTAKTLQHPEGILLHSTMQTRLYGDEAGGMFIVGGKTGYTTEAKNCLASFAVKYDSDTESESAVYGKDAQYIFVTAYGGTVWAPVFDAINMYATVADPDALETRQYSQR